MKDYLLCCAAILSISSMAHAVPWQRHTIDNSSRGADGLRLADVNGDGLADITTGWEEGGQVRVYVNPGPAKTKQAWPAVTVGRVPSPEDAVLVDLDGDGAVDVVSSCEGKNRTMYVHWAPREKHRYLEPDAWKTEAIPATAKKANLTAEREGYIQHQWMFALPLQVDGKHGSDLVAGSKSGALGWLQPPADARELAAWKYHPIVQAGWIMSLEARDMNGDGRTDVLVSDRKGSRRGIYWLEIPRDPAADPWQEHRIASDLGEVMFLDAADLDGDKRLEVIVAVKPQKVVVLKASKEEAWSRETIEFPEAYGHAKAVEAGDLDGDGRIELVVTCEGAEKEMPGVLWLRREAEGRWSDHDLSGPAGVKYDRIELLDLDADGDLDVLTCEERDNLGVVWYENPLKPEAEARDRR